MPTTFGRGDDINLYRPNGGSSLTSYLRFASGLFHVWIWQTTAEELLFVQRPCNILVHTCMFYVRPFLSARRKQKQKSPRSGRATNRVYMWCGSSARPCSPVWCFTAVRCVSLPFFDCGNARDSRPVIKEVQAKASELLRLRAEFRPGPLPVKSSRESRRRPLQLFVTDNEALDSGGDGGPGNPLTACSLHPRSPDYTPSFGTSSTVVIRCLLLLHVLVSIKGTVLSDESS
jgi:hypothetical protein